jgi:hypothetical protein
MHSAAGNGMDVLQHCHEPAPLLHGLGQPGVAGLLALRTPAAGWTHAVLRQGPEQPTTVERVQQACPQWG